MATKRALLVAINDYPDSANDLPSCVNDARAMESVVKNDYRFDDAKVLLDGEATIGKVEAEFKSLCKNAAPDDNLFFYYSGHGYQAPKNGVMEESLVLQDGFFADDKLVDLASDLPPGVLTVCLDSCFSGGMEKRVLELVESSMEVARNKFWIPDTADEMAKAFSAEKSVTKYRPFGCTPIELKWSPKGLQKALLNLKAADGDEQGQSQLNGLLITASSENETAAASTSATSGMSAFTYAFRSVLSAASPKVSVEALIAETNRVLKQAGFRQTPLVKANPSHLANRTFLSGRVADKAFAFESADYAFPADGAGAKAWQDLIGPIVTEVVRELTKSQAQGEKVFGIDDAILIPALVSVVTAAMKQKGFSFSAGGGVSTPFGGGNLGIGINAKAWQDLIGPIVTEVVRELTKSQTQGEKIFGIDDAILIPAIASVVAAAIKGPAQEKLFGIDDAILTPALVSVLTAAVKQKGFSFSAGGGVSTPFGGGNVGIGINAKAWQDLIGPIVTEVVRELTKSQTQGEKIFGIDDAILIPAIVSVVAAAVKQKGLSIGGGGSFSSPLGNGQFGAELNGKSWTDLIGPIVTEVVRELSKGQQKSLFPLPFDSLSGNDWLNRIGRPTPTFPMFR
jgi:hypothetical protein